MKSRKQILAALKRDGNYGKKSRLSVSANYGMEALDALMAGRPRPAPVSWSVNRGHKIDGHWVPVPIETYDDPGQAVGAYIKMRKKEDC